MLADHPALDLVGTVAERTSTRVEQLTTPERLADWLVEAGLLDTAPAATAAELTAARHLREALYAVLRATSDGLPLPPDALAVVHAAAAGPAVRLTLDPTGALHREGDATAALTAVARAAVELVGGPDRHLLRWCAGAACTHPFLDRSRGGRRRWCGMAGCGDRAKARAYRTRRRGITGGPQPS
jgi:predicted RNA-binding Zn ribbon-like protein